MAILNIPNRVKILSSEIYQQRGTTVSRLIARVHYPRNPTGAEH